MNKSGFPSYPLLVFHGLKFQGHFCLLCSWNCSLVFFLFLEGCRRTYLKESGWVVQHSGLESWLSTFNLYNFGEKSLFFEHFCQDSQFHPPSLGHTYHRWQRHYYGRCQFLTSRCLSCRPHLVFFPYGFLVYCESSTLEKEGGGQKKWFLEFKSHLSHLMAKWLHVIISRFSKD